VEDLFSQHFSLLTLCPNGVHAVHMNTEKYVPNPAMVSPLALQMFEFMGKLMGMSLRYVCNPGSLPEYDMNAEPTCAFLLSSHLSCGSN
jgi:hypothetical protein